MKKTRVTALLTDASGGAVTGLACEKVGGAEAGRVDCAEVLIATGGYANDHTPGSSLLQR